MKVSPEIIDELLSSYLDEELPTKQLAEVQRIVANDEKLARRLEQLRKCRVLLTGLPRTQAPPALLGNIKVALQAAAQITQPTLAVVDRTGAWHLFVRKAVTAAAMFVLVAALLAVIYNIIAPPRPDKPSAGTVGNDLTRQPLLAHATMPLEGTLELKTSVFIEADAALKKAIDDTPMLRCLSTLRQPNRMHYSLACDRKDIDALLDQLRSAWPGFGSATLIVRTDVFTQNIVVNAVTADQLGEIFTQNTSRESCDLARRFALANDIDRDLPGREAFAAIERIRPDLLTIPKPLLTGGPRPVKTPIERPDVPAEVNLTIVLIGSR